MMEAIQRELNALKIPFDSEGNRIRCFPHVINLAVKAGLREVTELPDYEPETIFDLHNNPIPQALMDNLDYWDPLKLDTVAAARKLVTACRASGQRREAFEATIRAGNDAGGWGNAAEELRVVGLLKDVETRWSTTFLMIDRVLEQYLAIDKFLNAPGQEEIAHHSFDETTLQVLQDIRRFLEIFHVVQETWALRAIAGAWQYESGLRPLWFNITI
ncbi:hypothetical protein B0H16DRAFT_1347354 [Mycena metata]|uniref:AC9 transposase n=1 Tax=Mycena metata TaxID=1033252 RepID=A0AAD7GQA5_9AGAR|nr:hypothetical protein B0H16DRAFT_1347354 [Mycena metata]